MADYRVQLDIYNGPLDLLLYLIRRNELDINDIPIAQVTEQYLQYVELLRQIDINLAGEFLVMAATLMEVKSAMLLPRPETPDGQEDLSDPRLELVRQLLEYKEFKDIAGRLGQAADERASRFARPIADLQRLRDEQHQLRNQIELENLHIWDLFDAFNRLMQATGAGPGTHEVIHDDTPIDLYATDILDLAQQQQCLRFEDIFVGRDNLGEMIGLFLALLELIRMRLIRIEQEKTLGPIYIFALTDEPAHLAVAQAISADLDRLPGVRRAGQAHSNDPSDSTQPDSVPGDPSGQPQDEFTTHDNS